jgi:hypothetical protein
MSPITESTMEKARQEGQEWGREWAAWAVALIEANGVTTSQEPQRRYLDAAEILIESQWQVIAGDRGEVYADVWAAGACAEFGRAGIEADMLEDL